MIAAIIVPLRLAMLDLQLTIKVLKYLENGGEPRRLFPRATGPEERSLTESFRYGPRTARIATQILTHNNDDPERIRIVGRGADNSEVSGFTLLPCQDERRVSGSGSIHQVDSNRHVTTYHFAATKGPDWNPELPYKFGFL